MSKTLKTGDRIAAVEKLNNHLLLAILRRGKLISINAAQTAELKKAGTNPESHMAAAFLGIDVKTVRELNKQLLSQLAELYGLLDCLEGKLTLPGPFLLNIEQQEWLGAVLAQPAAEKFLTAGQLELLQGLFADVGATALVEGNICDRGKVLVADDCAAVVYRTIYSALKDKLAFAIFIKNKPNELAVNSGSMYFDSFRGEWYLRTGNNTGKAAGFSVVRLQDITKAELTGQPVNIPATELTAPKKVAITFRYRPETPDWARRRVLLAFSRFEKLPDKSDDNLLHVYYNAEAGEQNDAYEKILRTARLLARWLKVVAPEQALERQVKTALEALCRYE